MSRFPLRALPVPRWSNTRRGHGPENRRAVRIWVFPRLALSATLALLSIGLVEQSHRDAATLETQSVVTGARVVDTGIVGPAARSLDPLSFGLTVSFRTVGGRRFTALVRPLEPARWPVGRQAVVTVRYNPADPSSVSYAGPGGDAGLSPSRVRDEAVDLLALSLLLGLQIVSRRGRLRWALRRKPLPGTVHVTLLPEGTTRPRVVRTNDPGGAVEEWRLLWGQRAPDGQARYRVHEFAGWRILRAGSGSVLWPASRFQPVLEAGTVEIPESTREPREAVAVRAWLAACGQIEVGARSLPAFVRRPPGADPSSSWWRFGPAPKVAIRFVLRRRVRARLRCMSSGLADAVLGPRGAGDVSYREAIRSAREDCDEFARRLSRPPPLGRFAGAGVRFLVAGLGLYAAYFQATRLDIPRRDFTTTLQALYLAVLALPWLAIVVGQRTVRCARAQLAVGTSTEDGPNRVGDAGPRVATTVGDLEQAAFAAIGAVVPGDRSRYVVACLWTGYAAIPLGVVTFNAGVRPTLDIVAGGLAVGLCLLAVRRWLPLHTVQDQRR